jgi:hypothetical protein
MAVCGGPPPPHPFLRHTQTAFECFGVGAAESYFSWRRVVQGHDRDELGMNGLTKSASQAWSKVNQNKLCLHGCPPAYLIDQPTMAEIILFMKPCSGSESPRLLSRTCSKPRAEQMYACG